MNKDIICWWSGGVTSAIACKLAQDFFGANRCRFIMIDTKNEHEDTYRFKRDCEEKLYHAPIEIITGVKRGGYSCIQDIWREYKSLNVATGAVCSTLLKRRTREVWQKQNEFTHQVFGFEFGKKEMNRALSMAINHSQSKPVFPLLMMGWDKKRCILELERYGVDVPVMYKMGFINNNCFLTGCVQGGIGYWQKMQREFPDKFNAMADMEHELTNAKGSPVTMLKSQSKEDKAKISQGWENLVFLKKHPLYPQLKCIDEMPQCKVEPLFECNGFCGINDLVENNPTEMQINRVFDF